LSSFLCGVFSSSSCTPFGESTVAAAIVAVEEVPWAMGKCRRMPVSERVQVLQTKLRVAEKLISEAKADHDREIPELRHDDEALVCGVASLDAEITQQFRAVQDQSEKLRSSLHSFERQTEGQITEVRADSSKMDRRLHELKTALDELAGRVGHQTSVLCALRADHDRVKRSVQAAELGLESASTSIKAIEEAAEVTSRGLDAIRKNIRVAIRVGAEIAAVLFAVTGVILWTLESAK
jgi:chromosome segregation ATPase